MKVGVELKPSVAARERVGGAALGGEMGPLSSLASQSYNISENTHGEVDECFLYLA